MEGRGEVDKAKNLAENKVNVCKVHVCPLLTFAQHCMMGVYVGNCSTSVRLDPNLLSRQGVSKHVMIYPQYCWEFHDRLWEALSGTTSEKKKRPQPYWGGVKSGNALEASNALNYRVWGIPAVLSTGIPGNALRAFPGFSGIFPEFLPESPSRTGGMAQTCHDISLTPPFLLL